MTAIPLPLNPGGPGDHLVAGQAGGAVVRRSVLPGGVRVLTESIPGMRSATFGCWVGVGSRDEADGHHGSTHFLEHLLFKGTRRRTAMDIASAFDAIGGEANAVTGKEHTCYYARVLDEDVELSVDLVCDMVAAATLADPDVESERGVILEELAMNDDDPGDVVHERFAELVLGDHPLGRPIGGTPDTIEAVRAQDIRHHYQRHYRAPAIVVTAAGGLSHEQVCAAVETQLGRSGWALDAGEPPLPRRPVTAVPAGAPAAQRLVLPRQVEQAHVIVGCVGLTATDPRRFVMSVLNSVLGGGMSSRLFQEIRERRGLAYSVYSFASAFSDSGYFGLYAACTPAKVDEVVTLLRAGLEELADTGISEDELARAHGQVCGGLVLGLEDSGSRMSRLGKAELVHGEYLGLDATLGLVRAVTAEQVRELARDLAGRPRCLAVVGPFEADREFPALRGDGTSVTHGGDDR